MTEQRTQNHLPPEMLASLLQTVRRRQQSGDLVGARVVLRALAAQQPDDPRIWLALATVVERRDEQRQALEHTLALEPQNALAQRALERFDTSTDAPAFEAPARQPIAPEATSQAMAPVSDTLFAPAPEERRARAIRWPLYLVIGIAAALVVVAAAALLFAPEPTALAPTPTQVLPGAGAQAQPAPTLAPASPLPATAAAPTAEPAIPTAGPAAPAAPTAEPAAPAAPATEPVATAQIASATPAPPSPTAQPALAPGAIVVLKPWHASLLRPDYAVLLDGAIGALQPRGRFALALVTVGNDSPAAARLPGDLFTLQDGLGNRYQPLPDASAAYLNTYGRGQRGDLSMDEEIPAGGGNVSVPLIFDVPLNARNLTLHVGGQPLGWPVGTVAAVPNPTATP